MSVKNHREIDRIFDNVFDLDDTIYDENKNK